MLCFFCDGAIYFDLIKGALVGAWESNPQRICLVKGIKFLSNLKAFSCLESRGRALTIFCEKEEENCLGFHNLPLYADVPASVKSTGV